MINIFLYLVTVIAAVFVYQPKCEAKGEFLNNDITLTPNLHIFKINVTGSNQQGSDEFLRHAYRNFNIQSTDIKLSFDKKDSLLMGLEEILDKLVELSDIQPNAVVLLVDANRTLFFAKKEDILNKFLRCNSSLVISTSRLRPETLNENQLTAYPISNNSQTKQFQFVDIGALIGKVENCKTIIKRMVDIQGKVLQSVKKVVKKQPKRKEELLCKLRAMNLNMLVNLDYISYPQEYSPDFNNLFFFSLGDVKRDEFKMNRIQDGPPFFCVRHNEFFSNPVLIHSQPGPDGGDVLLKEIYKTFSKGR